MSFNDHTVTLNRLTVLSLEGANTVDFLQDYVTADIKNTPENLRKLQVATFCDRQGRVIADVDIIRNDQTCHLILHRKTVSLLTDHLAKFLPFAKVNLDATSNWQGFYAEIHDAPADCVPEPGCYHIREGDLWLRYNYLPELVVQWVMSDGVDPLDAEGQNTEGRPIWHQSELTAGRVRITPEVTQKFLPQALGYEKFDGISYSKGCYLGQEIVARAHYRGEIKVQLDLLTCIAPPPSPGTLIVEQNGRKAGTVVSSVASMTNASSMLAVLRKNQNLSEKLYLEGDSANVQVTKA